MSTLKGTPIYVTLALTIGFGSSANASSFLTSPLFENIDQDTDSAFSNLAVTAEATRSVEHSDEHGYEHVGADLRILAAPFIIVGKNVAGASRESGVGGQVLKGITGISVKDAKKHGVFGGRNSFFRKPFGF